MPELGMTSFHHPTPADITQEDLEKLIKELNADPKVNGILVQLPLPSHLDEERVLQLISIEKDVDGFSPINLSGVWHKRDASLCSVSRHSVWLYLFAQGSRREDRGRECGGAGTFEYCRHACSFTAHQGKCHE
ncbi:MAG: tetrahydrofolate dehydrogenase/cyclohydrolase catalytic domain-containing protein [Arcicella sp.]|nr:tetrahydrofolate dehydrogenase/cyclohydrolase catalytic domain-containing protein [Arcicella sp.]